MIKGNFCARKSKKISIVIKNVIWSEKTLMHKAVRPKKVKVKVPNSLIAVGAVEV